jgi:hypothetical protein
MRMLRRRRESVTTLDAAYPAAFWAAIVAEVGGLLTVCSIR